MKYLILILSVLSSIGLTGLALADEMDSSYTGPMTRSGFSLVEVLDDGTAIWRTKGEFPLFDPVIFTKFVSARNQRYFKMLFPPTPGPMLDDCAIQLKRFLRENRCWTSSSEEEDFKLRSLTAKLSRGFTQNEAGQINRLVQLYLSCFGKTH